MGFSNKLRNGRYFSVRTTADHFFLVLEFTKSFLILCNSFLFYFCPYSFIFFRFFSCNLQFCNNVFNFTLGATIELDTENLLRSIAECILCYTVAVSIYDLI